MTASGDPRTPRPRDVEGFAAAKVAGRTPKQPQDPPRVSPGGTARGALGRLAFVGAVSVSASVAMLLLLPKDNGTLTSTTLAVFGVTVVVGVVATWRSLVTFRGVLLRELQAGYVTTTFEQGVFWMGPASRFDWGVVPWDWSGIWVLTPDGEVQSPPENDADPPGIYPSPHEPGRRELWTGCRWTMFYPDL